MSLYCLLDKQDAAGPAAAVGAGMQVHTRARTLRPPLGFWNNLDPGLLPPQILRGDGTGPFRGRAFMGTDGHPVSFADMMEVGAESGQRGAGEVAAARGLGCKGWGRQLQNWWEWTGRGGVAAALHGGNVER